MLNPIVLLAVLLCLAGSGQDAPIASENQPCIEADAPHHDFGTISDRKTLAHIFKIRNTGQAALKIKSVKTDKDCIVPHSFKDRMLEPGDAFDIVVRFNPARLAGEQARTLEVISNDPANKVLKLTLKAKVKVDYKLSKEFVFFKDIRHGGHLCETIEITSHMDEPLVIKNLTTTHEFFTATFRSNPEKGLYYIDLDLDVGKLPTGERRVAGKLSFESNSEIQPEDSLSVLASLAFDVIPDPSIVEARDLDFEAENDAVIVLNNQTDSEFEVTGVRFNNDRLQIRDWQREGQKVTIQYTLNPEIEYDTIEGLFELSLNIEKPSKVIVPFEGKLSHGIVKKKKLKKRIEQPKMIIPDIVKENLAKAPPPKDPIPTEIDLSCCPIIEVDHDVYDFGTVDQGKELEATFQIGNAGHADLIIDRVKSGCGCATVNDLKGVVIPPGENEELKVRVSTKDKALALSKSIRIYSNDPVTCSKNIQIKTYIHVDYLLKNPVVKFSDFREGMQDNHRVKVQSYMDTPLELTDFQSEKPYISCTFGKEDPKRGENLYYIDVNIDTNGHPLEVGSIYGKVRFKTNSPQLSEGSFNIIVETIEDIKFTPRKVFLYRYSKSTKENIKVTLTHFLNQPFTIKEIKPNIDCVTATILESGTHQASFELDLAESAEKGRYRSTMEITLEGIDQKKVEIPLTVLILP